MNIGIDKHGNLFYEGHGLYGHAVWPSPVTTPARIVFVSEGPLVAESGRELVGDAWIFREDAFDPVARIRRGRFYQSGNQQPMQWHVQPHPAIPNDVSQTGDGLLVKQLQTFYRGSIWHGYLKNKAEQPLVLLGMEDRFTIWTITNIELITTGEELVTLRARSSLGVLPHLREGAIPENGREGVLDSLNHLADEVYRAGPVSVIDRARDAAAAILSCFARSEKSVEAGKDLGKLIKVVGGSEPKRHVVIGAADIVRVLHARGKPSEQEMRGTRSIREQDAELAVQCIGVILCDLGWADWR